MTPKAYIEQLGQLVAAGKDREALALAEQHSTAMSPQLSREDLVYNMGLMEMAQFAVDLQDAEADERRAAAAGQQRI
jgi:hypothetical protein